MIKVGIIGSGFGLYGLLPAFNSIKNCKVICICGKKTKRLVDYCNSINLDKIYEDWELMLSEEKLDAIAIAVPPSVQYKIAKEVIKRGIHIFAEKPLASNLKEAEELLLLSKKNKIITAVDFIFPEIDEWIKVKEFIDKQKYGELKNISVNWKFLSYDIKNNIKSWKTDVKQGGGALSFYVSHVLYYLENFAGKIKDIKGSLVYSDNKINDGEVGVNLVLKFENGVDCSVNFSCNSSEEYSHEVVFEYEEATIVLKNDKDVVSSFSIIIHTSGDDEENVVEINKRTKTEEDERVVVVKKIAERFIDGCYTNKKVTPSFIDGVRVQKLIDNIRSELQ